MSASKARSRGIQGRQWVTLTDIAAELRVRPDRIRELGILEGCKCIPAGTIGRYELWRWDDVELAVLELAQGKTKSHRSRTNAARKKGPLTLPSSAFERARS